MAYFDCIVGGSGGKLKLTVTCDSGFAGATISCTDGTTTLTATCPSSSPYTVIFKIPNGGTWIVSSGSDSTTVVISDTATLHQIPTGSTATPVNVIQTWLHCANIWNKNYTTINQVLADTSTLLALISSNNAADYMARSTNWASSVCANQTAMGYIGNNNYCANKLLSDSTWRNAICDSAYFESVLNVKVPVMTSNTAPSGEAIQTNGYGGGYDPYKAFDNYGSDTLTAWASNGNKVGSSIGYKFTKAVRVNKLRVNWFYTYNEAYTPTTLIIQGSNNGSNWTNIFTYNPVASEYDKTFNIANNNSYKYNRVYCSAWNNSGPNFHMYVLQFWGR